MDNVLSRLGELKLIPVVKIENAADAVPLGEALLEGGLPVAEITFRTDAAEEAIAALSAELPELLVGAGTVLKIIQVQRAIDAGAKFIVAPGFNPRIVSYCVENAYPITPGVNSPTQIEAALEYGLEVVKFFPAEASGGLAMLKAMSAPYSGVRFIPTGGISAANVQDYLGHPSVLACGGSWMVKPELIKAGNFSEITKLCREAVAITRG